MRKRPKSVLSNAPLVLVLGQVRFSPLMAMSDYIAKIQDDLRRTGYPVNVSSEQIEVALGPQGSLSQKTRWNWEFLSKDRKLSVVLNQGFVVLQTTAYEDFDKFLEQLMNVTDAIAKTVGELLVTRVGIRYVDLIRARDGEHWENYVKPGLSGFSGSGYRNASMLQLHQVIGDTAAGKMFIRLMQNREGIILPPDLSIPHLQMPARFEAKLGELLTILDIDHFAEFDAADYDRSAMEKRFWDLKGISYETFIEEIVTPHAIEVWE